MDDPEKIKGTKRPILVFFRYYILQTFWKEIVTTYMSNLNINTKIWNDLTSNKLIVKFIAKAKKKLQQDRSNFWAVSYSFDYIFPDF